MNEDSRVISRIVTGDVESFKILVTKYEQPLLRFIRNLIIDTHDCEDIAQETFLAAYANLGSYESGRALFSTWLYTIARNKCLSAMKKKSAVTVDALIERVEVEDSPADRLERDEIFRQLDRTLAALPIEQRTAFVLAEIEGLSYEEIGRIENAKTGTIKSRISRAKERLRSLLPHPSEQR
jgi:RNA polymerase sigma-70 factor (ECF subfamily)